MFDKTFSLVFSETESDPLITRVTVVFETPAISAIDFLLTFFSITPFLRTLSAFYYRRLRQNHAENGVSRLIDGKIEESFHFVPRYTIKILKGPKTFRILPFRTLL